jgi:arginyl-tRNA synthetase
MFEQEQLLLEEKIRSILAGQNLPVPANLVWSPIPFSGEWGISTSFFQVAAQENRQLKESGQKGVKVPERAQEIALLAVEGLGVPPGFSRVEAVKGY